MKEVCLSKGAKAGLRKRVGEQSADGREEWKVREMPRRVGRWAEAALLAMSQPLAARQADAEELPEQAARSRNIYAILELRRLYADGQKVDGKEIIVF